MDWFLTLERAGLLILLVIIEIALCIDNLKCVRSAFQRPSKGRQSDTNILEQVSMWTGLLLRVVILAAIIKYLPLLDTLLTGTAFGTGRHLLLAIGGVYLIFCGLIEIRSHFRQAGQERERIWSSAPLLLLLQVLIVDLVLSVDSIVVAVSVSNDLGLLILSMLIAQIIICFQGRRMEEFFAGRKTLMTVIMAFIVLIGVVSLVRGMGLVLAEECLMAALAFGLIVEWLNHRHLRHSDTAEAGGTASLGLQSVPAYRRRPTVSRPVVVEERVERDDQLCDNCSREKECFFSFCLHCGRSPAEPGDIWLGEEMYEFAISS